MIARLTFILPKEEHRYTAAMEGMKYHSVLWNIQNLLHRLSERIYEEESAEGIRAVVEQAVSEAQDEIADCRMLP